MGSLRIEAGLQGLFNPAKLYSRTKKACYPSDMKGLSKRCKEGAIVNEEKVRKGGGS